MSASVVAFTKPAALAALALASTLTLAPMEARAFNPADGEAIYRQQAQCAAAVEVHGEVDIGAERSRVCGGRNGA